MSRRAQTSFSELSCLAGCEERWHLRYVDKVPDPPGWAQMKGTLLHAGAAAFWQGEDVYAVVDAEHETLFPATDGGQMTDDGERMYADVVWLLERYVKHYAADRESVKVVATELELRAKLPGTTVTVLAYIDQLWEIHGKLWLVERKSMGKWDRLDILSVDPQLTLYDWMLRENGYEPHGICFDAIKTYRWKPEKPTQAQLIEEAVADSDSSGLSLPWDRSAPAAQALGIAVLAPAKARQEWARAAVERHPGVERPLEDSFQQLWLARDDAQRAQAIRWARAGVRRKRALQSGSVPVHNIGVNSCRGCPYQADCFERLGFDLTLDMEED